MAGTRLLLIPTCALSICLSVYAEPEQAACPSAAGLVEAALERTQHRVRYDGRYVRIGYPGGDVPADTGVCSDLVIRSYRQIGIDLQVLVHEDIENHFSEYPHLWGMSGPDTNIDHRRVPNLQTFFARHGESLGISANPAEYLPGDLVTWMLPGNLPHIGIIIDRRSGETDRPLVVHNIGNGPVADDILFRYPITGHYRYFGDPLSLPRGAIDDELRELVRNVADAAHDLDYETLRGFMAENFRYSFGGSSQRNEAIEWYRGHPQVLKQLEDILSQPCAFTDVYGPRHFICPAAAADPDRSYYDYRAAFRHDDSSGWIFAWFVAGD